MQQQSARIIYKYDQDHYKEIIYPAPHIKYAAHDEKKNVFEFNARLRIFKPNHGQNEVADNSERQKDPKEQHGAKKHEIFPPLYIECFIASNMRVLLFP